ncbi:uncharacterized protein BXIN_2373 [Babesia sp. Xinjiang]|uniref:uncharacterized protein n=1 Tax=Babesia sp. Xinjiang TaxID=462227 RepID=UPI000A21C6DD|nr:uncharacterized protein BXIN_2373 [Babesia sp. Xinjiang]ORM40706.1 hypothetical protein BXIN_2373 [Babesia sp. Xinjiang]
MLFSWLPFFILGISSSLLVAGVDRSLKDKGGKEVEGALKSQLTTKYNVPDMSWSNAEKLLKEPPTTDHIVLFYVPLHVGCRQFLNIFTTLAQQFQQEERHVTFVKVDCSRASFRENICHRYNISAVPTVAYVSTLEFQRELLPSRNMLQCSLRWSIANMMEDIGAVHATW